MAIELGNSDPIDEHELAALRFDLARARAKSRDYEAELLHLREVVGSLSVGVDLVQPMSITPVMGPRTTEGCAVACLSDVHYFETVRPEEVSGRNAYNLSIAQERLERYVQGVLDRLSLYQKQQPVPQLVLAILGDVMTGMLHPDQTEYNAGTPQEEQLAILDVLVGVVDSIISNADIEKLVVVCADGNHGRATEKPRVAGRVLHSNEWVVYQLLARFYQDNDQISFQIAQGQHIILNIFDRPVRFQHGDLVRYQGGIGGLTIPLNKAIRAWNRETACDLDILGHWHQCFAYEQAIVNGSVIGYTSYSRKIKAEFEPPRQAFVLLDKQDWVSGFNHIYLGT